MGCLVALVVAVDLDVLSPRFGAMIVFDCYPGLASLRPGLYAVAHFVGWGLVGRLLAGLA